MNGKTVINICARQKSNSPENHRYPLKKQLYYCKSYVESLMIIKKSIGLLCFIESTKQSSKNLFLTFRWHQSILFSPQKQYMDRSLLHESSKLYKKIDTSRISTFFLTNQFITNSLKQEHHLIIIVVYLKLTTFYF